MYYEQQNKANTGKGACKLDVYKFIAGGEIWQGWHFACGSPPRTIEENYPPNSTKHNFSRLANLKILREWTSRSRVGMWQSKVKFPSLI